MAYAGPERRKKPRVPVFTCPACHGTSNYVKDSRGFADKDGIQRWRECRACHTKFRTEEYAILPPDAPTSCVRSR